MKYKQGLFVVILLLLQQNIFAADDAWSGEVRLTLVEPLVSWNGGMIRVLPATATNPRGCSMSNVYDFVFTEGTQETRAAVISALYMAFASGKKVKYYISGSKCSVVGSPIILGLDVIN